MLARSSVVIADCFYPRPAREGFRRYCAPVKAVAVLVV